MRGGAWTAFVMVASVVALRPAAALADPTVQTTCSDAYLAGQHLMHDRRLVEARDALLVCARDPCPHALQPECAGWLADVQRSLPSIVILAERGGVELRQVRVTVDGRPFLDELDGTSKDIDPGDHTVRLEAAGDPPVEQRVLVHEGERSRLIRFSIAAAAKPEERTKRGVTWPVYLSAGAAVVGVIGWTYFGVSGLSVRSQLDSCTAACDPSKKQTLDVDWALADAAIGLTLVSVGVGTYFFFRPVDPAAGAKSALAPRLLPVLAPRRGGGTFGVDFSF